MPNFAPGAEAWAKIAISNLQPLDLICDVSLFLGSVEMAQFEAATIRSNSTTELQTPMVILPSVVGTYPVRVFARGKEIEVIGEDVTIAPEEIVNAEFLVGYVMWEGVGWKLVGLENQWPADTDITLGWIIQNTGTIGGYFLIYMRSLTEWVYIEPGEQAEVYEYTHTPPPQTITHRITLSGGKTIAEASLIWDTDIGVTYTAPTATLYGVVTDAETGYPLSGVKVTIDGLTTYTDASGNYGFTGLTPGSYAITFEKEGYETASPELPGQATLYGKVTDSVTGYPLSGVLVSLNGLQVYTDSEGSYIFEDLEPGGYVLQFSKEGYQTEAF